MTTKHNASSMTRRPRAPASTTPAASRTGNCVRVRPRASAAASTAHVTTTGRSASGPRAPTATAASSTTVTIVPSTGTLMTSRTSADALPRRLATAGPSRTPWADCSSSARITCEMITPELPRAPAVAPRARAAVRVVRSASGPAPRILSTAARTVKTRLVPVSESGIGKTLSSLISSQRSVRRSTQR